MSTLELEFEKKLIHQLCQGDSQWTYRQDIKNEEDLWKNFKYILEQNNKAVLNDTELSDSEFAKIKNDVSHATFYDAGKWLVGENGKVYVHVQRGNEQLHLCVMNNEHIAGGTSVYEVINQYNTHNDVHNERNRILDVTLLINGVPMIHIELKNKDHSFHEGFNQIKKYASEGVFRGLYSNIQMFVVSNMVDTKYFAPARDTELNKEFMTGWIDEENKPVCDCFDFTKSVLRIPEAHEMVTKYTVLDNDKKRLIILRPYQVHAIRAMRKASKQGKSGYIWHTTGSGKTMTSYKATRNLLMDIPSIEKTVFLIDRKDLDSQTSDAFKSYANNDTIDVDGTDNVDSLIKRLADNNRQMIVTTRQKLQIVINKRLKEGTKEYDKIRNLRVAFVVDECHRAVTPETKRLIERFFNRSLWYGFTGTPIFEANKYEAKGDLPQTTAQLYGDCLHSYTIKEAIHDKAVLGFMVENLGSKDIVKDTRIYDTEDHMREVLNVILNKSQSKIGVNRGKDRSYEAILTVNSIEKAQRYYDLLKRVKSGDDKLKINENITKVLPDFPKFAITYSVTENEEDSCKNQDNMKRCMEDYNNMFGTTYTVEQISAYNENLNKRLARKEKKYYSRNNQLDLVIVVNRLLTGFDAPCLSTLFIDRQPMSPQDLIQSFSRTNRIFEEYKQYGQIVTFQSPDEFKEAIDNALKLYSRGGEGEIMPENWDEVLEKFAIAVKAIHSLGRTAEEINALSDNQKKAFVHHFRDLDKYFAHLKAFTVYDESILEEYDFSEDEYTTYAAIYKNLLPLTQTPPIDPPEGDPEVDDDYTLVAQNVICVDFDYIIQLIQGLVESIDQPEHDFIEQIKSIREDIENLSKSNPRLAGLLSDIVDDIEKDKTKYYGEDISVIVNERRYDEIDEEIEEFARKWYLSFEDIKYEVEHYRDGIIANENTLKDNADYKTYKENTDNPLPKFKFRKQLIRDFKEHLMISLLPLL